jgi:hypothetical protein
MVQAESIENERILRQAFWSGKMSYRKWRGILRSDALGHKNILLQSFRYLSMSWLLQEIGEDRFVKIWPSLRSGFNIVSPEEKTARDAWDAVWGMIAAGDSQYPIDPAVAGLSRLRREVLRLVINNPGVTAYSIAKETVRSYSRVHKDIRMLIENGMVAPRPMPGSVRKERCLMPKNSINASLAEAAKTHPRKH